MVISTGGSGTVYLQGHGDGRRRKTRKIKGNRPVNGFSGW